MNNSNTWRIQATRALGTALLCLATGCATLGGGDDDAKKAKEQAKKPVKTTSPTKNRLEQPPTVTKTLVTLPYSLSNNALTTFTVDRARARTLASQVQAGIKKPTVANAHEIVALMALRRYAREDFAVILGNAKTLIRTIAKRDIRLNLPESAMLELGLSALENNRLAMAEHFLYPLESSKNKKMRAAYFTALGLIYLRDEEYLRAQAAWNKALTTLPNYVPAILNNGLLALTFGNHAEAVKMFRRVANNTFGMSNLIMAQRLAANRNEVTKLCVNFLARIPDYKPARLSCALNEYQGFGLLDKAKQQLQALVKLKKPPLVIDEIAFTQLEKIEAELIKKRRNQRVPQGRAKPPK